jgi:hypothetical protein
MPNLYRQSGREWVTIQIPLAFIDEQIAEGLVREPGADWRRHFIVRMNCDGASAPAIVERGPVNVKVRASQIVFSVEEAALAWGECPAVTPGSLRTAMAEFLSYTQTPQWTLPLVAYFWGRVWCRVGIYRVNAISRCRKLASKYSTPMGVKPSLS